MDRAGRQTAEGEEGERPHKERSRKGSAPLAPSRRSVPAISRRRRRAETAVWRRRKAFVTPHDFRRAVSTWLGDRGERPDIIEAVAGHAPSGVTRLHYNLSLLLPLVG